MLGRVLSVVDGVLAGLVEADVAGKMAPAVVELAANLAGWKHE